MIISWADKETEKIWNGIFSKKYPMDMQRNALDVEIVDYR